jgi:DNA repair exonuclease SbcCD ATPase subunit
MKLKYIEWRNIKSFGNSLQRIDMPETGGLWMVAAPNGSGKTTTLELPKVLYYGRLDKFTKEDIANRLNRHGYIKGEVETSPGISVTIERNLAPTDLTVYKHMTGEFPTEEDDIGRSGINNYQDYIDNEVVGLPYHIFSNIISLSVNDFKSFISMTPRDKRIIIDKLFAMEIINKMNEFVKRDLREIKINIDLYDREIKSLRNSIKSANRELEKLKEEVKKDNTERIEKITNKLKEYKPKLEDAFNKRKEYENKSKKIKEGLDKIQVQKNTVSSDLRDTKKKIKLYESEKCPTCETPFTDNRFDMLKGDLSEKQKKREGDMKLIQDAEKKYREAERKTNNALKKLDGFINELKNSFSNLSGELQKLKKDKPKEFKSIENIIAKGTRNVQKKESERVLKDENHKYLTMLDWLYGDSGIKKKILDSYLPTLNSEIDYTLKELHFPYKLRFNNSFEPILTHLGLDINVSTLSTGETKRVDLAVLISIIRMLKRKYPSLNIFMLDEVLSSIDGDGIYDILGILQKTAKEMSLNIFIINHSVLPIEYFSYRIDVKKIDGFSEIQIEELGEGE